MAISNLLKQNKKTDTVEPNKSEVNPGNFVDQLVAKTGPDQSNLIYLLQQIQFNYNYLPQEALRRLSEVTACSESDIAGVSTFYTQFRLTPAGRHRIRVCHGTACHVKGSEFIDESLRRVLRLADNVDTDRDKIFTIEPVACLGCCTLAPVIQIDGATYGNLEADHMEGVLEDFLAHAGKIASDGLPANAYSNLHYDPTVPEIRVTVDSCCQAIGSVSVMREVDKTLSLTGIRASIKPVSCTGLCHQAPLIEIHRPHFQPVSYTQVKPDQVESIIGSHFTPPKLTARVRSLWNNLIDTTTGDINETPVHRFTDASDGPICAFIGPQKRIAMEHSGSMIPLSLDSYLAHDGMSGYHKAMNMDAGEIISVITKSGLRGRGGAGFPTGKKWELAAKAQAEKKYIICNGDEGDPGAFMDRMLLESFPYRIIEGMLIAARAIGATEGIFYIRAEYPRAVKSIETALQKLTDEIPLRIRVVQGAGAFVCGEETALIASLEGRRGEPRLRPPYPVESGLFGYPTCISNVETLANVPWIMRNGSAAFASIGTEKSKGTKVFSLAGKVKRGGLIEVPMGVTIRQIVEQIGGGVADGHSFKAVQIGGPSGGCIPANLCDTPVDFEALNNIGAIMGSGGMVVLDDTDCMIDIARYFLKFTQKETCGQCSACRIGTKRMLDIIERICNGNGHLSDIEKLEELADHVSYNSLCGLGQTAPNPVLTTLRYFRSEYEAHIKGRCPAKVCRPIIRYEINSKCIGCTLCAQGCPVNAIEMTPYKRHTIQQAICTKCDSCRTACPESAIDII